MMMMMMSLMKGVCYVTAVISLKPGFHSNARNARFARNGRIASACFACGACVA